MYQYPDGTYSYVLPVAGTANSLQTSTFLPIPAGAGKKGLYHTHGAYDPDMNLNMAGDPNPAPGSPGYNWHQDDNEVFSDDDKGVIEDNGGNGYLGTPQGTVEEYVSISGHPLGGTVTVLSGRNCGCKQH